MNVEILLTLKKKIDTFSYGINNKGKEITGIDALRSFIVDNYLEKLSKLGFSERYVKDQIKDLYDKLETIEEKNILDKPQFNFTCSEDVTYYILKALNISYEDVLENDFGHFRAKTEYDKIEDKMDFVVDALNNLSETVYLCNAKPKRSDFAAKIIDFNIIFNSILYFNNRITFIDTLSEENKISAEKQLKTELLCEIFRLSNIFFNYPLVEKLLSKPLPSELMMIQYFNLFKESKKTLMDKALENIKNSPNKANYYDDLYSKIENEINNIIEETNWAKKESPSTPYTTNELVELDSLENRLINYNNRLIFYKYSCTVCLFDFINRTTRDFTIAAYNNFSYMISKKFQDSVNKTLALSSIPLYLQTADSWKEFYGQINTQFNIKLQKETVHTDVEKMMDFTKTIGSKLHQLAVYLGNINQRNYTNEVLNEMKSMFSEYLEIVYTTIFLHRWIITDENKKKMDNLTEKLDTHSIIVGHGQGGIDDSI